MVDQVVVEMEEPEDLDIVLYQDLPYQVQQIRAEEAEEAEEMVMLREVQEDQVLLL
jgi:hypothetical protein